MRHDFKFSGMIAPDDVLHRMVSVHPSTFLLFQHEIAPNVVEVTITNPGPTRQVGIPQYAVPVVGTASGYDPAGDCGGCFMSSKYQPNNNCYAYACDIAANSFPQPGRAHGNLITAATLNGPTVQAFAVKDGLIAAGTSMAELKTFENSRAKVGSGSDGHYVALMISAPDGIWTGDYHWARCDDPINFSSWSQKDGGDQVTNFDFAGQPITNPATANWTVNQGPLNPPTETNDLVVDYVFFSFMFVPHGGVTIL